MREETVKKKNGYSEKVAPQAERTGWPEKIKKKKNMTPYIPVGGNNAQCQPVKNIYGNPHHLVATLEPSESCLL